MSTIGYTDEGRSISINQGVAARLSEKELNAVSTAVEGIGEVDWDIRESNSPDVLTREFKRSVGLSNCVTVGRKSDVFYAQVQWRGRPIWGKFVRGRKGRASRFLSIIIRPVSEEGIDELAAWNVVGAYSGKPSPGFPGDPFGDSGDSQVFWANHALLDGALPYRQETVTKTCPW